MKEVNLNGDSTKIKIKEYEKNLKEGYWLNRYHAKWCHHCVNMTDEWGKFVDKIQNKCQIKICSIEEEALNKLNKKPSNFEGYPTIQLTKDGELVSNFSNPERTCSNFQKFVSKYCKKQLNKSQKKKTEESEKKKSKVSKKKKTEESQKKKSKGSQKKNKKR